MRRQQRNQFRTPLVAWRLLLVLALCAASAGAVAEPTPAAVSGFNSYAAKVEARLDQQHRSVNAFLAPENRDRLRAGEFTIEQLTPSIVELPGAMLHHWRGTAFAPGATVADYQRLMRDFSAYPKRFAPQVVRASVLSQKDNHFQTAMRVRQKHVITVVMDTNYDVTFEHLDTRHGFSISRSTRVTEIESPGSPNEHALGPGQDHGFLWRLNTYWTYEELDGGLYMQIESISLTRSIPKGLGWIVKPFVEGVPRESLEFTLRSTCNALGK